MSEAYVFRIRTPQASVWDQPVLGARVPTESGSVGLRPGGEPLVLAVAPGLVVLRTADGERFGATAGGLLRHDRAGATLLTPFAVVGSSEDEILAALADMYKTPNSELVARRQMVELEQKISTEAGRGSRGARSTHD